MRPSLRALLAIGGTVLAAWIAWGVYATRSAEPVPYESLGSRDGVEFRRYSSTVLVETTAPDQRTAFRRLFRYISGDNMGEMSIGRNDDCGRCWIGTGSNPLANPDCCGTTIRGRLRSCDATR